MVNFVPCHVDERVSCSSVVVVAGHGAWEVYVLAVVVEVVADDDLVVVVEADEVAHYNEDSIEVASGQSP